MSVVSQIASSGTELTEQQIAAAIKTACQRHDWKGKRILLIIPDATRTAPVGPIFKALHRQIASSCAAVDVMVALGTHAPMKDEAILARLELTEEERAGEFSAPRLINHEWDNPKALRSLGKIPAETIAELSQGLFAMDVEVTINERIFEYDRLIIIGPVFPHEVVGFSGGNKYLFPGISGPEVLNFFHWLGAVITNPLIIGHKWTPVRKVVDKAASLVPIEKLCFALVVDGYDFAGLFIGTPEAAWDEASELSAQLHIDQRPKAFHTVLSCAPAMYDELWVGGKCMYKLEPVVADGGELIIYAPHIHEISVVHGALIEQIGYHCRDYFLKRWDQFKHFPWGVVAHSTHVRGIGTYEDGVEQCRIRVTLATGIPEATCRKINLGYRDPATIRFEDYRDREDEGILFVPSAGEKLFRLEGSVS